MTEHERRVAKVRHNEDVLASALALIFEEKHVIAPAKTTTNGRPLMWSAIVSLKKKTWLVNVITAFHPAPFHALRRMAQTAEAFSALQSDSDRCIAFIVEPDVLDALHAQAHTHLVTLGSAIPNFQVLRIKESEFTKTNLSFTLPGVMSSKKEK